MAMLERFCTISFIAMGFLLLIGCETYDLNYADSAKKSRTFSLATLEIMGKVERMVTGRCVDEGSVQYGSFLSSASQREYRDDCVIALAFTIYATEEFFHLPGDYRHPIKFPSSSLPIVGLLVVPTDDTAAILKVGDTFKGRLEANKVASRFSSDNPRDIDRLYWQHIRILALENP